MLTNILICAINFINLNRYEVERLLNNHLDIIERNKLWQNISL